MRFQQLRYIENTRLSISFLTLNVSTPGSAPRIVETIHAHALARALAPRSTPNSFPSNVRRSLSCAGITQLRSEQMASRYSQSFGRNRPLFSRHSAVASVCAFPMRAWYGNW